MVASIDYLVPTMALAGRHWRPHNFHLLELLLRHGRSGQSVQRNCRNQVRYHLECVENHFTTPLMLS